MLLIEIWAIFVFLIGACVGSFLNVVIWRLPRGESIAFPPSHCPKCGKGIHGYDNIPILSWLILRGRCRNCRVRISPRYIVIEALTAMLFLGVFWAYYVWGIRDGMGTFEETWWVYVAHITLLTGLLALSIIDIETFHVPLELCWFISLVGLVCATACPTPQLLPTISPAMSMACVGAAVGLIISWVLQKRGVLIPSFIDAEPYRETESATETTQVAMTTACGVSPRREMVRELIYLAPAILGAIVGYHLCTGCLIPAAFWNDGHVQGFFGALCGYLVGGLWIWGIRILGTFGFGKEAMGLGDVHILAAAGAVCGWVVPTIAFFVAPVAGLVWALYLAIGKGQRELPYGPWLSVGVAVVMLGHDWIWSWFELYLEVAGLK